MKLLEAVPQVESRTVYLAWADVPENCAGFEIYLCDRLSDDSSILDAPEDAEKLGSTTNAFFTDLQFFDSSILRRDKLYLIRALDNSGQVCDSLVVEPMKSSSELVQRRINGANHKAQLFFRNPNWAEPIYILRYKKTGKKCKCYSQDFGKSKDPTCDICFGGGYVGGFYSPIPSRVMPIRSMISNNKVNSPISGAADIHQLRLPRFPAVYEGDFLYSDSMGIMIVTNSNYNKIRMTATPLISVDAAGLSREHPATKFKFDTLNTSVDCVTTYPGGKIVIRGKRLIPRLGVVKLYVYNSTDFGALFSAGIMHIKSSTEDELVFQTLEDTVYATEMRYTFHINNSQYDGRCQVTV